MTDCSLEAEFVIDCTSGVKHTVCMKRTTLMVNESLLEEALKLSGERTYSRTVERALEDFVRRIKSRRILELSDTGLWRGSLAEMRSDSQAGEGS